MGNIKLYIYGAIGLLGIAIAGAAYGYYSWSQSEIATLTANNSKLTTAVELQKDTITSLVNDAVEVGAHVSNVSRQFREARSENNVLRTKLAKHDLAFLAEKKPGLIQKIVTHGTKDVGRCFEILSGSPLTEKEIAATLKSQTNSSCPDIANPNYKVKP